MTYDPNIPISTESPANQVVAIQNNFNEFNNSFNVQHTSINATNQGKHEDIVFQKQTTVSNVVLDQDVIYSHDATSAAFGVTPQLFLKIPKFISNVANTPMQLTYDQVNKVGPIYQSFLPGGYVLYFGSVSNIVPQITLSPTPTEIVSAIAMPNNMTTLGTPIPFDVGIKITQPDKLDILSTLATGIYTFTWMAIAKQ